jgi:conjugative transfer signal peptidase TraF
MSQPICMLALASAAGVLSTVAISTAAFARIPNERRLRLVMILAVIVVVSRVINASGLRLNVTSSMPVGIYRLAPIPQTGLKRGMLVAVCVPLKAAQLGRRRAYLSGGPCAGDTEPLLKIVAAIAGDSVSTAKSGITVNGRLLPDSKPVPVDSVGRSLKPWPLGSHRLKPHQIWLYADHAKSWDSRYWGPIENVLATVTPLATMPRDPR